MTRFIVLILSLSLFLGSCNTGEKKAEDNLSEKDLLLDSISKLEKSLHSDIELNSSKAANMIELYKEFYNKYEEDENAPEFLFRAAEILMNSGKPADAVNLLNRIRHEYPDFDKVPYCIYLTGFIYDSMINNDKKAEKYYDMFLEEYPEHERAEEVKRLKEYLGMSDLELVKKFAEENTEN